MNDNNMMQNFGIQMNKMWVMILYFAWLTDSTFSIPPAAYPALIMLGEILISVRRETGWLYIVIKQHWVCQLK